MFRGIKGRLRDKEDEEIRTNLTVKSEQEFGLREFRQELWHQNRREQGH
jgi:hypothetical protein